MSAMDLLERYLQAVGQYLPEEQRMETLRELRANLLDEMDARAESQGRTLEEGDVAAVLREHGKPEVVALRYLPQRSLIGPAIYPFYVFTLRRAVPIWLFCYALAKSIELVTSEHGTLAQGLAEFAFGLIPAGLAFVAAVTVVFVVIDWAREKGKLGKKFYEWNPMKLAEVKPQGEVESAKSLVKRVIDLGFHCLWMAYLLWVPWHPFWMLGPGVYFLAQLNVAFAPAWHTFYGLLVVLVSVQLVAKLLGFVPRAQTAVKALKVCGDLLGVVALGWMAFTSIYFVPVNAHTDLAQMAQVNHAMAMAFRVAAVYSVFGLGKDRFKQGMKDAKRVKFAF